MVGFLSFQSLLHFHHFSPHILVYVSRFEVAGDHREYAKQLLLVPPAAELVLTLEDLKGVSRVERFSVCSNCKVGLAREMA